jgi:hypothetical protein
VLGVVRAVDLAHAAAAEELVEAVRAEHGRVDAHWHSV